jgi:uncharacterized protein (DUF433 family)
MSKEISTLLVSSHDVCGGRLRIDGTRITVNQIVVLYKQGYNPEHIADQYSYLTLAQVYAALAHYHANRDEVEADIAAERKETPSETNALNGSPEKEVRLETFKALQRNLSLTPARAAEWQDAVREARR